MAEQYPIPGFLGDHMAVSQNEQWAYASSGKDLAVADLEARKVVRTIPGAPGGSGMGLVSNEDLTTVYAVTRNLVYVIDANSGRTTDQFAVGKTTIASDGGISSDTAIWSNLLLSPDGQSLTWVAMITDNADLGLIVVDLSSHQATTKPLAETACQFGGTSQIARTETVLYSSGEGLTEGYCSATGGVTAMTVNDPTTIQAQIPLIALKENANSNRNWASGEPGMMQIVGDTLFVLTDTKGGFACSDCSPGWTASWPTAISAIDTKSNTSNTVSYAIPGEIIDQIVAAPKTGRLYAAGTGITPISVSQAAVEPSTELAAGLTPIAVALNGDETTLYVLSRSQNGSPMMNLLKASS